MFVLFRKWFNNSHHTLVKICNAAVLAIGLNLLFGLGFYVVESGHQEGLTLTDSVWWAMVTMTTVGYGDYYPVTFIGRFLIAYPCFLIGIGFIGFLFGVVLDSVMEQITKKKKGYAKMHLKDHYVICNCPSKKKVLKIVDELRTLAEFQRRHVVIIDSRLNEQPISFKEKNIHFVKGDATSEQVLERAGIYNCSGVLILAKESGNPASDAETFAIGTVIKMMYDKASIAAEHQRVVLELVDRKNRPLLERVGAGGIVAGEGISDHLLVQELHNPGLSNIFDQLISYEFGAEFYLMPTKLDGRLLREIQIAAIKDEDHIQILGVVREGETYFSPVHDFVIEPSDRLIVLAHEPGSYQSLEDSLISSN